MADKTSEYDQVPTVSVDKINEIPKFIAVKKNDEIKILNVNNIVYLKSSGRYTYIYLAHNIRLIVCKNLGYYENLFKKNFFLRVHNSYLINLDYLEKIFKDEGGQYCQLNHSNIEIPISNRRFSSIKNYLHY